MTPNTAIANEVNGRCASRILPGHKRVRARDGRDSRLSTYNCEGDGMREYINKKSVARERASQDEGSIPGPCVSIVLNLLTISDSLPILYNMLPF